MSRSEVEILRDIATAARELATALATPSGGVERSREWIQDAHQGLVLLLTELDRAASS